MSAQSDRLHQQIEEDGNHMSRGVLSGFLTGTAASTAVVAVMSVLSSAPKQPEIVATAPTEARTPPVPDVTPGEMPRREDGDPLQTATPVVAQPDTGPSGRLVFDTADAPVPKPTVSVPDSMPVVSMPASDGSVEVASTEPVYPNPRARAPEAPMAEAQSDIVVDTQPAAPLPEPAPVGIQQQLADAAVPRLVEEIVVLDLEPPLSEGVTEVVIAVTPNTPAAPARPADPALPSVSVDSADPVATGPEPKNLPLGVASSEGTSDGVPVTDQAEAEIAADLSNQAETAEADSAAAEETISPSTNGPVAQDVTDSTDLPQTAETAPAGSDAIDTPETEIAEAAPSLPADTAPSQPSTSDAMAVAVRVPESTGRVTIGTPAKSLADGGTGVLTERIPRLRRVAAETETNAGAAPARGTAGDAAENAGVPALQRFARDFEAPSERPLLSIVLIDAGTALGEDNIGIEALGSFPYALTVAIDVSLPDAADRAALYRSQGMEVMAMVDLPPSLTASDTEVALAAALQAVPESVAVLEGPQSGLQGSKDISDQVSAILKDTGHGIIWQPNGLDTAQKLASRAGIPSQTLFRDFDSKDQKPVVIRRFLDQAAFKAGQRGSVVMVGRLRPETISALLVWGLQDRASRVAVAPVSAVLSAKEEGGI